MIFPKRFSLRRFERTCRGKRSSSAVRKSCLSTSWSISLPTNWVRPGEPSIFRWHRSGSLPRCANACAHRSTSPPRSIAAASIFSPSPGRSIFAGLQRFWDMPHRSGSRRVSAVPRTGTGRGGCCDRSITGSVFFPASGYDILPDAGVNYD